MMNIDLVLAVISCIVMAILTIFVIVRNVRAAKFSTFAMMCIAIIFWIITNYLVDNVGGTSTRYLFAQLSYLAPTLVVSSFLLFTWNFNNSRSIPARQLMTYYAINVVGALLAFNSLIISGVIPRADHTDIVFGNYYFIFLLFILVLYGLAIKYLLVYRHRSHHNRLVHNQVNFILLGTMTPFVLILIINGIMPVFTKSFSFAKYTPLSIILMAFIIAYSIVKHRLFDIRLIVARSVTYILSIVTIGAVYALTSFKIIDQIFFPDGPKTNAVQQTIYSILAIVLAFTFQPLKRQFERLTDKIFYRDKYDSQLLINTIGRILASEIELATLTKKVTSEIKKQMRVDKAVIVITDNNGTYHDATNLDADAKLYHQDLVKLGTSVVAIDVLPVGERSEIMHSYGVSVAAALRANGERVGFLMLGAKLSGDAYRPSDIEVIKIIVNELAVAVQNAKAYTEIQRFNETLQQKVKEATAQLRKANEDLKTLDQAKDEFISMASHQLRTPLTTAKGYVSMVLDGDYGKLPTKMKPPLDQALDSSNRMAGLINDLLNVSRMDAGKFFIDATDVDLAVEVQGELNQLVNLAAAKQVTVTYHEPKKKIPLIKLDLDKTRQVIMNIADNAIYYSAPPNGGGKVDVYLDLEGDAAVFKVVDNGIGVPDNIKPKLFAKFFRAGNAQSARPDGTGLGLYLVKRVVEDQGGTILFESQVGKGSTFGFKMPIHNKLKIDKEAAKRLQGAQEVNK